MIRGLFAKIGCLVVLVVGATAGWLFRGEIQDFVSGLGNRGGIEMVEPSLELAVRAEEKLQAVFDGTGRGDIRLSEMELQSYVQYRLGDRLPEGVTDPAVDLRDSTLAVSASLDLTRLAVAPDAVEVLQRMMGDSALVRSELRPGVVEPGVGRVEVLSLQAGVIPLPPLGIGMVLRGIGLPTDGRSVTFEIPDDVQEIRVGNEEVVLVRGR